MSNGTPRGAVHHKGRTLNTRILCLVFTMMVFGVLAVLSLISLRATQAANFELGQKLLQAENNAATIMATLRDAQESLERVSAEASAATKGQQQANQDLDTLNKENTGLKAELKELRRSASASTTQLATCTNKLAEALERANNSAAQLNSLKAQAAGSAQPQQQQQQQQQQTKQQQQPPQQQQAAAKAGGSSQLEQALQDADREAGGSSGSSGGGGNGAHAAERRGQREAGAEEGYDEEERDQDAAVADARFPREGDLEEDEEDGGQEEGDGQQGSEPGDERQGGGQAAAAGQRQGGGQRQGTAGGGAGAGQRGQ